jgi:hypothetical protein
MIIAFKKTSRGIREKGRELAPGYSSPFPDDAVCVLEGLKDSDFFIVDSANLAP